MKYGGALTKQKREVSFAVCRACETVYQDDVVVTGSIECPQCKGICVERGLTKEMAIKYLDDEYKELLR